GVHAHRPELEADWPAIKAFKIIGRSAASQVLDNWISLSQSDDSEVPHQLRIGLRRLRVCLRIFQSHLTSEDLKRLSEEARDMGRLVGDLRNADVLLEDIAHPAIDALGSNKQHRAMIKHLEESRQDLRKHVREAMDSERWTHFKLNCMLFEQAVDRAFLSAATPSPDETVEAVAERELERTWQRVLKKGRNFSQHTIEQRHDLRKTLKSMRYASEHFLQLHSGDEPDLFFSKLRQLQNVFGYLNDVAMAEELDASIAADMHDRKDLQRSMAAIVAWHRERSDRAMQKADQRWQKLLQTRLFWRS
ncbi:MAG: CHAD domain-containing protein, partial [Pseudomonadota bacterium]